MTNAIQFQLRPVRRAKKEAVVDRGKLPRITEVLALALQFDDMIRRGVVRDHADLARLGCISRERISQIMRLVWLAPDIQQEILLLPRSVRGRYPINEVTARTVASKPLWRDQREIWRKLHEQTLVA